MGIFSLLFRKKAPDPVGEFYRLLVNKFGEFVVHDIAFLNDKDALAFYHGLSFVSGRKEGEVLGEIPDNIMMRVVRYSKCVKVIIAGHLTLDQNYEILYETQKISKASRMKLPDPTHVAAVKSQDHFAAKAFFAAAQRLATEHTEFCEHPMKE